MDNILQNLCYNLLPQTEFAQPVIVMKAKEHYKTLKVDERSPPRPNVVKDGAAKETSVTAAADDAGNALPNQPKYNINTIEPRPPMGAPSVIS